MSTQTEATKNLPPHATFDMLLLSCFSGQPVEYFLVVMAVAVEEHDGIIRYVT